jgi:hypothetical protein
MTVKVGSGYEDETLSVRTVLLFCRLTLGNTIENFMFSCRSEAGTKQMFRDADMKCTQD